MILIINIIILELATEGWWNILKNALTSVTLHVGNQHNKTKGAVQHTMRQCLTPFLSLQVRSTTETSGTGTRNAIPVSFPFSSGITFPTAFNSSTCRCWNYILMSSAAITPFLGWRQRGNKLSSNIMYFSIPPFVHIPEFICQII